jgi:hypothetical protein
MATGIFNNKSKVPVEIVNGVYSIVILDTSWEIPAKPLAYTSAGIRKKFIDIAFNKAPINTIMNF